MPPLTLVVANKNYSSWSLQAWTDAALQETEFVPADEPYAQRP